MEFKLVSERFSSLGTVSTDGQPFVISADDFDPVYETEDPALIRTLQRSPHVEEVNDEPVQQQLNTTPHYQINDEGDED